MNPRDLTVAEIDAYLARTTRPRAAFLRSLATDPRHTVRRVGARYQTALAATRAEARRLRLLYGAERSRLRLGQVVAGVDEVGRGCLAGPVVAGVVILGEGPPIPGLNDSKRLPPAVRERLDREIRAHTQSVAIGVASVEEIDRFNILRATRLAMRRAVEALSSPPDFLLIDGRERLPLGVAQEPVVDGDGSCACIAAASIVAKVARDRLMLELDRVFPGYGFARHKGYGTAQHLAALASLGPCPAHRQAFLPQEQTVLFGVP